MKKTVRVLLTLFVTALIAASLPACAPKGDPKEVAGTYFMTSASGRVDNAAVSEEDYEYYRVILNEDGTCAVRAKGAGGGEAYEATGKFSYAEGKVNMTTKSSAGTSKETYLYENGVLTLKTETRQAYCTMLFTRMDDVVGSYELSDLQASKERVVFDLDYFEYFRISIDLEGNASKEYRKIAGKDREYTQKGAYTYKDGTIKLNLGGAAEEYVIRDGAIKFNLTEDGVSFGITLTKDGMSEARRMAGTYGMFDVSGTAVAEVDGAEQSVPLTKELFAERFESYQLVLTAGGAARFEVQPKDGAAQITAGTYVCQDGKIVFTGADGSSRSCAYADGVITVEDKWEDMEFTVKLAEPTGSYEMIAMEGTVVSGKVTFAADKLIESVSAAVHGNGVMDITVVFVGDDEPVVMSGGVVYEPGKIIPVGEDGSTEGAEDDYFAFNGGLLTVPLKGAIADGITMDIEVTLGRIAK